MIIQKAFKYRLRTNPEIEDQLRRMAGCRRFVWNNGLAAIKAALDAGESRPRYIDLAGALLPLKAVKPFLAEDAPSQALQQTLKDLDKAVKDAFDKKQPLKEFPVFKQKGKCTDSFRIPQGFEVDQVNSRIKLPKMGWLRYRNSRNLVGLPKNVTVSLHSGHWYISIQTEQIVPGPVCLATKRVGVDRGITVLAAFSDGLFLDPLNILKQSTRKLAKLQRKLSRKVKFSQNWKKAKERINRLHSKIAATRKDFLNKASTTIAKNHSLVVLEDLKIKNMTASAKGTIAAPGKKVKQKAGLNKAILDQGWGELARQIEYKLRWLGGTFLKIPPQYTSQKCSCCGHTEKSNRNGIKFVCLDCGFVAHADTNAAHNILAAGLAVIACGEQPDVKVSMKQEPPFEAFAQAV
jgi:putative transposase